MKYQGRNDEIRYNAQLGTVIVSTTTDGMEIKVTYPMSSTEEEFFQNSLLYDMNNNTFEDFKKLKEMYHVYYKLAESMYDNTAETE
jgi:hypothetical protein